MIGLNLKTHLPRAMVLVMLFVFCPSTPSATAGTWKPQPVCGEQNGNENPHVTSNSYELMGLAAGTEGSVYALFNVQLEYLLVVKILRNGKLDSSFGDGGIADVSHGGNAISQAFFHIDPSGMIYVGGGTRVDSTYTSFLRRIAKDGHVEDAFKPEFFASPFPIFLDAAITAVLTKEDGSIFVADTLSHIYSLDQTGARVAGWNDNGVLTLPTPPVSPSDPMMRAEAVEVNRLFSYPDPFIAGFQIHGMYHYVRKDPKVPLWSYPMIGCVSRYGGHCSPSPQRYSGMNFYIPGVQLFDGPFNNGPKYHYNGNYFLSGVKMINGNLEMAVARMDWTHALDTKFGNNGILNSSFEEESGFRFSATNGSSYAPNLNEFVSVATTGNYQNMLVWKLKGDGKPVEGFGNSSHAVVAIPEVLEGVRLDLVDLVEDGSPVVGGACGTKFSYYDACVLRVAPSGKIDDAFGYGGFVSGGSLIEGSMKKNILKIISRRNDTRPSCQKNKAKLVNTVTKQD